jgi:hypothetical protein
MHDRTLAALAQARPKNPRELLLIDGIGPAKVERFGKRFYGFARTGSSLISPGCLVGIDSQLSGTC